MISAPVTAFAVVPIATANYRAAILCSGTTLTSSDVGYWSAFGGKAVLSQTSLEDSVARE
jgi:hypothetical protein